MPAHVSLRLRPVMIYPIMHFGHAINNLLFKLFKAGKRARMQQTSLDVAILVARRFLGTGTEV